ncbi:MAG: cell division protein FtsW, partial [Alphaproteobacteria bacterium]|nr:cell division protein FtsW [Alphaproteobacteria bacterium]
MRLLSIEDRSFFSRWWWSLDRPLLVAMLTLALIGTGLVMSAGPAVATRIGYEASHFTVRHIAFVVPSVMLMLLSSMLMPKHIWRVATFVGAVAIGGV